MTTEVTSEKNTLEEWLTRAEHPFVFYYHPHSYVESNLDGIISDYHKALAEVVSFLSPDQVPQIEIHLSQYAREAEPTSPPENEPDTDRTAQIWTTINSESRGIPEIELTQLLLSRTYGQPRKELFFWYDGLAGHISLRSGRSAFHSDAPKRIQELFEAGQLPPLTDLLALYGIRKSGTGESTATAFVGFLLDQHGPDRYKRLLQALSDGDSNAFQRACGAPLQSLEQAWYRLLETTGAGGSAKVADAVKQLVPYMKMYRKHLLAIFVCILVTISFAIFMPMAIRVLVNNILGRGALPFTVPGIAVGGERLNAGEQQIKALVALLGAMMFMFFLSAFSNVRRSSLMTSMGEGINFDLRMQFYRHLQRLPIEFHRRTPNQDLTQRFGTDVNTISQALTLGIVPMAQGGLAMLFFAIVLISLNWKLALVALAGLPIFAISFQRMRSKLRDTVRERSRRTGEVNQTLIETLNAQEKIKVYGLREFLTQRFTDRLSLLQDLVARITNMAAASVSTSALITNGAQVAVLILGGLIVIQSGGTELAAGDLMAFYVLLLQLYAPAGIFTGAMQYVSQSTTSLDRVNTILKQPAEDVEEGAVEIGPLKEAIRFEQVNYGRAAGKDLLKNLSLEIKVGTKVAFVGPPGAGKASLIELLPRMAIPASGSITWDGIDFQKIEPSSLRAQMSVVSQETYVFRATIYDNIRYGRVGASDDEVIEAAKLAGLHEFILALPGGYDTQVSDRDSSLGLVQRQRLEVARSLLHGGSVIVMDDALSALDAPGQRQLEDVLRGPQSPRTLIRIAQRIGSILDADHIFAMDNGQLVEQGRHEDLAEANGVYTQLLTDELGAGAISGAFQAIRRLAKQAPFSALPPVALEELARLMLYAERSPGDIICRQGSVGDELFVLGRGEVEVVLEEDDGNERILGFISEGEYFGEISFLRRVPRTATVRARTKAELHILRRQDFDELLEKLGDDISEHLDRTAQERINATRAKLAAGTVGGS